MSKEKKNIFFIITFLFLEILLLINPNLLVISVKEGLNLFVNKLFISLFPFFILNEILIDYNLAYYVSKIKKNIVSKLFNISNISSSIIILSILNGHPSNAKYIKDFLDKKLITIEEATKVLLITFLPSPVFVIMVIGYLIFNNIYIGIILLLLVYLFNFSLGLLFKNKIITNNLENSILIAKPMFFTTLKKSILNSFNSLMIILGNIIIFTIILNLINHYINLPPVIESIISAIIELTGGIKKISMLNTEFSLKFSLSLFALMISGLSVFSQASSLLENYKINFKLIYTYKIILAIISFFISFFSLKLLF